jgi:hypothetical protein
MQIALFEPQIRERWQLILVPRRGSQDTVWNIIVVFVVKSVLLASAQSMKRYGFFAVGGCGRSCVLGKVRIWVDVCSLDGASQLGGCV